LQQDSAKVEVDLNDNFSLLRAINLRVDEELKE
jgi:hypothetical protein